MVSLEQVRAKAAPQLYPRHVLVGCDDALVLFAAAWHGKQDAVWMEEAGLRATCVDLDAVRLAEMAEAYPDTWEFVDMDVFDYTTRTERMWDVVSIDSPTNLFDQTERLLALWALIARNAIIIGSDDRLMIPPKGWEQTEKLYRSSFNGGVYWQVFQRCK